MLSVPYQILPHPYYLGQLLKTSNANLHLFLLSFTIISLLLHQQMSWINTFFHVLISQQTFSIQTLTMPSLYPSALICTHDEIYNLIFHIPINTAIVLNGISLLMLYHTAQNISFSICYLQLLNYHSTSYLTGKLHMLFPYSQI